MRKINDSENEAAEQPLERRGTYVNPDVGGLLVDDVRLRAAGHRLQALLPASRVVGGGDEEGRGQQHQLQLPLTAVQKGRPAAKRSSAHTSTSGEVAPKRAGIGSLGRSTRATHYLPSLVHPTLAMYSVPGKREVKGTASSLSCVLTICEGQTR